LVKREDHVTLNVVLWTKGKTQFPLRYRDGAFKMKVTPTVSGYIEI